MMTMIVIICDCFASDDHDHGHDDSAHRLEDICQFGDDGGVMTMTIIIICGCVYCFECDDHDHDNNSHRLEDVCQLGDDGGVEGGEEGHRAQEVDLVLQLLQTWSAELLGIMQNY